MSVLVIGASGHIGAHLCRTLLAEGYVVRALVRPTSDTAGIAALDVEVVHGDVLDGASLGRAMAGCTEAYHLGAPTGGEPGTQTVIGQGTRNVLEQALHSGLQRVVYTSSIVTVGYAPRPGIVLDESSNHLTPATPYHAAKWHAEREVMDFSRRTGLPVVVVNPATVVGSLDLRVTPSNAPIQRCLDRGLPFTFDSGLTIVHAEDVARGHLLAMRRGRPGERYILGGDRLTIRDYFRLISSTCQRRGPWINIPTWAMFALGAGFSLLHRLGKKRVPFTWSQARQLVGKYGWYSSHKAVRELGYRWRPAQEAIADYVAWAQSGREAPGCVRRKVSDHCST
jgi:dihydroflavonol-4-reductase